MGGGGDVLLLRVFILDKPGAPVNAMATASPEGDEDAEVRLDELVDDELRDKTEQELQKKAQRIQNNLTSIRLPDGGKKYHDSLISVTHELA